MIVEGAKKISLLDNALTLKEPEQVLKNDRTPVIIIEPSHTPLLRCPEATSTKSVGKNTEKQVEWAIGTYKKWVSEWNKKTGPQEKILVELENMSKTEIAKYVNMFVSETRKEDGSLYSNKSLCSLLHAIQRYLRTNCSTAVDFRRDPEFTGLTIGTILADQSSKQSSTICVTKEMEDSLWERKFLGDHNPEVLIRTLLYLNTRNFHIASAEGHRSLGSSLAQIVIHEAKNAISYLEFMKTNSPDSIRQYADNNFPERCHLRIYKKYISVCPHLTEQNDFYYKPKNRYKDNCWYSIQVIGHNTILRILPDMMKDAGYEGRFTFNSFSKLV